MTPKRAVQGSRIWSLEIVGGDNLGGAEHYDFTDEEPDLIINYDIKKRLGDELRKTTRS